MTKITKVSATLIAAATAGLASGAAQAQSSVTLYGSVDFGVNYTSNIGGGHVVQAVSGNSEPDKWGLRGVEDLGGGLKAIFQLENGFTVTNGQGTNPGSMFNRKALISLSSNDYGTVTMGHGPSIASTWVNPLTSSVLADIYENYHPGNIDELTTSSKALNDNMVRYTTPSWRGLQAAAEISLGNTTNFGYGRSTGYGVNYNSGPIRAAVTYEIEANRATSIGNSIGISSFQGVDGSTTYVADKLSNLAAAFVYDLGRFSLHALYTNVRLEHGPDADTFQTYEAGTSFRPNPFNQMDVTAYTSTLDSYRWTQVSAVEQHFLSKSTSIYAAVAYQHATGGAKAVIYSNGPSSGANQFALYTGVHHSF
ncbi:porin [Paraburkholderia sp. ZP32-5]|uniref:porin n=1 Tax=Paraburkholderia sp. ZP32-5 TaxID=2883245 RepID=UPI001F1A1ED5|nr:porin [Paraburkholderia sp. ZP32-5]